MTEETDGGVTPALQKQERPTPSWRASHMMKFRYGKHGDNVALFRGGCGL